MNTLEVHDLTIMVVDTKSNMPYCTYKAGNLHHRQQILDSILKTGWINAEACGAYLDTRLAVKEVGYKNCPCPTCQIPLLDLVEEYGHLTDSWK